MATTTIKQHIPIFVSSTFEDMRPYRDAVGQSIVSLEHVAKGMELFGSSPETPLTKCLSEVRQSSLFICLVGMRYGSVEEDSGRSFTYLEYEEAIKNSIPVLVYILSEETPILPKFVDKDEKAEKLVEFKRVLTSRHVYSHFDSPADLKSKVTHDIVAVLENMSNIEMSKDVTLTATISSVETMKNFYNRPKKYNGKEVELTVKLAGPFGYFFADDWINSAGLVWGDIVGVGVKILDGSGNEISALKHLTLYADGVLADSLEKHAIGDILKIRVKLSFVVYKALQEYDGGKRLTFNDFRSLILIDILK